MLPPTGRYTGMKRGQSAPKKPKGKSDNIIILYSIIFCIALVVYIRYIM